MNKNCYDIIEKALQLIGESKPNILFIAADVRTEYLLFYRCDYYDIKENEAELQKLGVTYVVKHECLGIERFRIWDYTFE